MTPDNSPSEEQSPELRAALERHAVLRKAVEEQGAQRFSLDQRHFLALHPNCEAGPILANLSHYSGCKGHSNQVHHMHRRGSNLNVEATWLAVCPHCHHFIETHASVARSLGLLR